MFNLIIEFLLKKSQSLGSICNESKKKNNKKKIIKKKIIKKEDEEEEDNVNGVPQYCVLRNVV